MAKFRRRTTTFVVAIVSAIIVFTLMGIIFKSFNIGDLKETMVRTGLTVAVTALIADQVYKKRIKI